LSLFVERLVYLKEKFGEPESVVLEFVREDFMGRKAKLEYNKFIKDRAAERAAAKKKQPKQEHVSRWRDSNWNC